MYSQGGVRQSPFSKTDRLNKRKSESMRNLIKVNPVRTQQALKQLQATFNNDEDLTVRRLYG